MWRSVRTATDLLRFRGLRHHISLDVPVGYGPNSIARLEVRIMFEQLFHFPSVVARHRAGPFAQEREHFLFLCAERGMARSTLLGLAPYLLVIAQRLNVDRQVTEQQIEAVADQWRRFQRKRGRSHSRKSRERFIQIASDWLNFLGQMPSPEPERFVGVEHLRDFTTYMVEERGLSAWTVRSREKIIGRFLREFSQSGRPFSAITIADIDTHLESLGKRNCCRVSIANVASELRLFFAHAGMQGWCSPAIAAGIRGPRIFKHEKLTEGPAWPDVERLILSANSATARDIRDQAILRLFATYGFRRAEVSGLRLNDIDWARDRLLVSRPKQRSSQEYPLLPSVGEAIARYLHEARPKTSYREIFLTLRAPIVPISRDGLYDIVYSRLKALGISSPHRGPHGLRHACATRLVAQGLSLKEIGDHLGHRSAFSTRTYAKVDLAGLREVAALDLGDLL